MSTLIMWNLVSLDGFFDGPKPWDLDWHNFAWGDEMEQRSREQLTAASMLVFGRATYQGMAGYWPPAQGDIADFMNGIPKVVFSNTLEQAEWDNTRIVRGRAEEEVALLKQQSDKDMLIFGSANLASTLTRHGLIDEYRIGIVPVVLGGGTPLFKPSPDRVAMQLVDATTLKTGCVIVRYRPAGATN